MFSKGWHCIRRGQWRLLLTAVGTLCLVLFMVDPALGYETYSAGCNNCHGSFNDSTSPKGTVFPGGSKHTMHRSSSYMGTDCNLCHMASGTTPVYTYQSEGTVNNPGLGCVGCHGGYYGPTIGYSGAGLRMHHAINGVTVCAGCHSNDPTPLPESVKPQYYGTPDTNADDPCNAPPSYLENWSIGDTEGLDNDGDNFYDQADPDCAPACVGDLNCDGFVNFGDINPLVLYLSNYANWLATFPGCNPLNGDINQDGSYGQGSFGDINPFVALMTQCASGCPCSGP